MTAEFFSRDKNRLCGFYPVCKLCTKKPFTLEKKEYNHRYYIENHKRVREQAKEFRDSNKEKIRLQKQASYVRNRLEIRARRKLFYKQNRDRVLLQHKVYSSKNRDKLRAYSRKHHSIKQLKDPLYVLKRRLRRRMLLAVQMARANKSDGTMKLLGCSPKQLMEHIQKQFKPGMAWNNRHLWHIDHIRPCASFDLLDLKQQKQCFHYTNLQPLWAGENLCKADLWKETENQ